MTTDDSKAALAAALHHIHLGCMRPVELCPPSWMGQHTLVGGQLLAAMPNRRLVPADAWEAMQGDAADLHDVMGEAAALRTALAHVLIRTHDTGCGTCDAARALLTADHELPSRAARTDKWFNTRIEHSLLVRNLGAMRVPADAVPVDAEAIRLQVIEDVEEADRTEGRGVDPEAIGNIVFEVLRAALAPAPSDPG